MNKRQRDNLVKFFYTLSTASFTGLVIGTIIARPTLPQKFGILGTLAVIVFAIIEYLIDGMEPKE